jgi:PAS domain S-box-containing protein
MYGDTGFQHKLGSPAILDEISVGIALFDHRFALRAFNKTFADFFETYTELTADRALGLTIQKIFPVNDAAVMATVTDVLDSGESGGQEEYEIRSIVGGREFMTYWDTTVVPLFDSRDEVEGIAIMAQDVTERKKSSDRLKASETLHRAIFEATGTASMIIENDTTISRVNSELEKLWGYSKNEVEGHKSWKDFVARQGDLERMKQYHVLRRIDPSFAPTKYEFMFVDRYGNEKHVFCRINVVPGTKKHVASLLDITYREQVEEELRLSSERLHALAAHLQSVREEQMAELSREIHDELGQELTAITMELAWLGRRIPEGDSALQDKISSISNLVGDTIELTHKISRELRPRILDELGLVAALEWQAKEFQDRTGILCVLTAPDCLKLKDDRATAIFRIVQEGLTNVARHAAATGVTLALEETEDSVVLRIEDNGVGIKADAVSSRESLGLLGMRERALVLGGEVSIKGTPGEGTTVAMTMPLFHDETPAQEVGR